MNSDKYIKIFKDSGALLDGHFVLTSGRHSSSYFQCAKLLQYPKYLEFFSRNIADYFKDNEIDAQIVKVNGAAMSLQQKIHNVAVSILKVWHDDKDALKAVARINALQDASPYHTRAFSVWVGMMLPLQWADENKVWFGDVDARAVRREIRIGHKGIFMGRNEFF